MSTVAGKLWQGIQIGHRVILPALGRRATAIATVSESSRDHLVSFGVAEPEKITVVSNGADHASRWNADRSSLVLDTLRPFVFCLGQQQPYKNLEFMLKLSSPLDRLGLNICIAGDAAAVRRLAGPIVGNLHILEHLDDDDMAAAYSRALCFLFPSRIEGFGLTAVEAMAKVAR